MAKERRRFKFYEVLICLLVAFSILFTSYTAAYAGSSEVSNFVTRFYQVCLDRQPDPDGLNYWVNALNAKQATGADLAYHFIFSQEFQSRNVSNSVYMDVLYKTFFNRTADSAGKSYWVGKLTAGVTRTYVLASFVNSQEFNNLCSSYGINRGSITLTNPADIYPNITIFVNRLYLKCLGRGPDTTGLNYWVGLLASKKITGSSLVCNFVYSPEFLGKGLNNYDFVTVTYNVFLNRNPDPDGLAYWVGFLDRGYSWRYVLSGFAGSQEFKNLCSTYGIECGSVSLTPDDIKKLSFDNLKNTILKNIINRSTSFTVEYNCTEDEAFGVLEKAFDEISISNPDEYAYVMNGWLAGFGCPDQNGLETMYIFASYTATKQQEDDLTNQINSLLPKIINNSMTTAQKEKAIHDWIVNNIEYDYTYSIHDAYNTFIQHKGVCLGYACLTYKMLKLAGIQSIGVYGEGVTGTTGGSHAWNLVNVDGRWYHLDTTWDDVCTPPDVYYGYFNLTDAQISTDHVWNKADYPATSTIPFSF